MDGRFLTAFIVPKTKKLLGYKLRPYCLRHCLYLTALGSPLVDKASSAPLSPEMLIIFCRVCSGEPPETCCRKPSFVDEYHLGRMIGDSEYFLNVLKEVMNYVHECSSAPVTYSKESEKVVNNENVPGPLNIAVGLMANLGFTPDEAWDTPVGQAIWYLTAFGISQGADTKILSTEQEARASYEKDILEKMTKEHLERIQMQSGQPKRSR